MDLLIYSDGLKFALLEFEIGDNNTYLLSQISVNTILDIQSKEKKDYNKIYTNCVVGSTAYNGLKEKLGILIYSRELEQSEITELLSKFNDLYVGHQLKGRDNVAQQNLDKVVKSCRAIFTKPDFEDIKLRTYLSLMKVATKPNNSASKMCSIIKGDIRHRPRKQYL